MIVQILNTRDAAQYLGLSQTCLEHWRMLRTGPPFVRVGARSIRYRLEDLEAWLKSQLVETVN